MNKYTLTLVVLIILLAGCSLSETTPIAAPSSAPVAETSTPAAPPVRSTTTPPPTGSTTSSEFIGDTRDCTVEADCVSYVEKDGTPAELCAHYDDMGCYRHYACSPIGEVVQKETPAFCGRS